MRIFRTKTLGKRKKKKKKKIEKKKTKEKKELYQKILPEKN